MECHMVRVKSLSGISRTKTASALKDVRKSELQFKSGIINDNGTESNEAPEVPMQTVAQATIMSLSKRS